MTFESSKMMSAVGALLLVIGAVAGAVMSFSGVLSLVGLILLLIGLKGLATHYNEDGIFSNALYAVIIAIVGCVIGVGVIAASAVSALSELDIDWASMEDWANVGPDVANVFADFDFSAIATLLGALLIGLVILYVVMIVAMIFFRKSMNQVSEKSGVGLFSTAGLLMLIGAIIPVVGWLLIWIGAILVTVAFFQMKEDTATATTQPAAVA